MTLAWRIQLLLTHWRIRQIREARKTIRAWIDDDGALVLRVKR